MLISVHVIMKDKHWEPSTSIYLSIGILTSHTRNVKTIRFCKQEEQDWILKGQLQQSQIMNNSLTSIFGCMQHNFLVLCPKPWQILELVCHWCLLGEGHGHQLRSGCSWSLSILIYANKTKQFTYLLDNDLYYSKQRSLLFFCWDEIKKNFFNLESFI